MLLAVCLCLVAFTLRGPMTALAPVLPEIMRDTGLHASGAGAITTVPLLCLGLLAPFAPGLLRRLGPNRALLALMLMIAAGCLLRILAWPAALLASGVLVGGGSGMANVLLPSRFKRDFPSRAALMIGVYTMVLATSAAIGQAISVPLADASGGWPLGLAWWAVPAGLAGLAIVGQDWLARRRDGGLAVEPGAVADGAPRRGLWREPMAWQITFFMGLQSSFTFTVFAWLPPLLRDRGLDAAMAGYVTSASTFTQMIGALVAPMIAARLRDQRAASAITFVLGLAGFLGCRYLPLGFVWSASIVMGLGQGAMFGIALILLVLRSPTPTVTAQLSSMAQTAGYLMAAVAPIIVGVAHDWMGNWGMVTPLMVGISAIGVTCGALAGRRRVISPVPVAG